MPDAWEFEHPCWEFEPLTREQRIKAYYLAMAGTLPGPNLAFIAVMLAHRLVELEDESASEN